MFATNNLNKNSYFGGDFMMYGEKKDEVDNDDLMDIDEDFKDVISTTVMVEQKNDNLFQWNHPTIVLKNDEEKKENNKSPFWDDDFWNKKKDLITEDTEDFWKTTSYPKEKAGVSWGTILESYDKNGFDMYHKNWNDFYNETKTSSGFNFNENGTTFGMPKRNEGVCNGSNSGF